MASSRTYIGPVYYDSQQPVTVTAAKAQQEKEQKEKEIEEQQQLATAHALALLTATEQDTSNDGTCSSNVHQRLNFLYQRMRSH